MTEKEALTTDRQLHTPGPWHIYARNPLVIESTKGNIALVNLARASEADARLIAAAPELLESLKEIAEELANQGWHTDRGMLLRMREAVAKAEGRS